MNTEDIVKRCDQADGQSALYQLFRDGLVAAATVPELETEAEKAAHHFLGCANFGVLLGAYEHADSWRRGDDADEGTAAAWTEMADLFLRSNVQAVVAVRGAIGTACEEGSVE